MEPDYNAVQMASMAMMEFQMNPNVGLELALDLKDHLPHLHRV